MCTADNMAVFEEKKHLLIKLLEILIPLQETLIPLLEIMIKMLEYAILPPLLPTTPSCVFHV